MRKNGVTDEQILETYQRNGSGNQTARELGVCIPTVFKVLHKNNVTMERRRGRNRASDQSILEAYERLHSGITVSKQLHVSTKIVYEVLSAHNIATDGRLHLRHVSGDIAQRVLDLHNDDWSINKIANELGLKRYPVWSALERVGAFAHLHLTPQQKQRAVELYKSGMTSTQAAADLGIPPYRVMRLMADEHPELVRENKREYATGWKGGRFLHKGSGYWYVLIDENDPFASMRNREGYVLENRYVMAKKLGRVLTATETVHHKNTDRNDNAEDNLQLRQGRHGKNAVMRCADCGSHNIVADDL